MLGSGIPEAGDAFTLIAVCIAVSIVAHSSTDVPVARVFDVPDETAPGPGAAGAGDAPEQPAGQGRREVRDRRADA